MGVAVGHSGLHPDPVETPTLLQENVPQDDALKAPKLAPMLQTVSQSLFPPLATLEQVKSPLVICWHKQHPPVIGVGVCVGPVGVVVAVAVCVPVRVIVGVRVTVRVRVIVPVCVTVGVMVAVPVTVGVRVIVGVWVIVGVRVMVPVAVMVGVLDGVMHVTLHPGAVPQEKSSQYAPTKPA